MNNAKYGYNFCLYPAFWKCSGVFLRAGPSKAWRASKGHPQGTFIYDVPNQVRQGGPRQPKKRDVIEQDKVGRLVKNGQKTSDVINECSLIGQESSIGKFGNVVLEIIQGAISQYCLPGNMVGILRFCPNIVRFFSS